MKWPFDQGENVAAVTTVNVMKKDFPVLQVIHYSDDHSWAFLCGTTADPDECLLVSMKQVLDTDPSLFEIADLPPGWIAERESITDAWERSADENI